LLLFSIVYFSLIICDFYPQDIFVHVLVAGLASSPIQCDPWARANGPENGRRQ
jgi:hypothetical protein